LINAKTQNWFDERVPDMVNEKTLKRQLKKAEREENERNRKIQQKMKLWAESGNYIYKCISEFLLAKDRFARDPKKYYFLDSHHMVPRAVGDAVKKKIKNGDFSAAQCETLKKIDYSMTREIPMLYHRNFNRIFRGDCILTQVIWTLDGTILNANYSTTSMSEKTNVIEFMFYVAYYNGREIEPDRISREVSKKYSIVPYELLRCFDIDYSDIMRYLEDNFFYPRYDEYWDVWELLEWTFNKKTLPVMAAEDESVSYMS